ncbi:MAG: DUF4363 family protein [Ruminococcus sp.]|jgi:hypothetical protein|nr:DUF4363 family protein [Ruminococcus sp.]
MKRVILSTVIIAAAVIYSIGSAVFADKSAAEIKSLTERIEAAYLLYAETDDSTAYVASMELSEKLEREAEKYENAVSIFVRDERLSTLEYSAARVRHLIKYGSDEVSAELESVREQVETIAESEIPFWYNIL